MKVFLDTHVAVRLYDHAHNAISPRARDQMDRATMVLSPIVRMELAILNEIGRIRSSPSEILEHIEAYFGVRESSERLPDVVTVAQGLHWTRDPFDRLIVATAMVHQAPLITSDRHIQEHFPQAIW